MAYKALYRTYRPATFLEVAGQQHIVKTLQNALNTNKIAHAYLFCGPRGTGKTSMAKLLAKALNCEEGLGHQCNHCSNCLAITDGSHPDVIEIDAASNNGVEEVRDLIEKVKYSPIKGKYKVYIIDEVHMMTPGAFNALLKTLEEPPSHVVFILATTEAHKVLPTIVSRCQRYDFSKVDEKDIIKRLKDIFAQENITYSDESLQSIATLADGGMRDALSISDQVIAYGGNEITEEIVEELFGLASIEDKINFLIKINEKDAKYVLAKMKLFIESGIDIKRLTGDLLDILKDVIILRSTLDSSLLIKLKENQARELGNLISNEKALTMIDILLQAQSEFKFVNNINTLFQIVLLKLLNISHEQPIVKKVDAPQEEIKENKKEELKLEENQKQVSIQEEMEIVDQPILDELVSEGEKNKLTIDELVKLMVVSSRDDRINLMEKWKNLEDYRLHPTLGNISQLLLNSRPYLVNQKIIVLEFQFSHEAEKVNIIKNQKSLRNMIKMTCGIDAFIYALSRNESIEANRTYLELRQLSRLPKVKIDELEINIKGE